MSLERLHAALADRYRIERELGGGGMSRVFAARELSLNRDVVIKVVSADGVPFFTMPLEQRSGVDVLSDPLPRLAAAPSALAPVESAP